MKREEGVQIAPHLETGQIGEGLAVAFLKENGWEILQRNFTTDRGEIDIVARRVVTGGSLVAFVEVKSRRRSDQAPPELSVTARKRRTITAVARNYADLFGMRNTGYRFDVISVDLGQEPPVIRHFQGAFDAEGNPY